MGCSTLCVVCLDNPIIQGGVALIISYRNLRRKVSLSPDVVYDGSPDAVVGIDKVQLQLVVLCVPSALRLKPRYQCCWSHRCSADAIASPQICYLSSAPFSAPTSLTASAAASPSSTDPSRSPLHSQPPWLLLRNPASQYTLRGYQL